MAVPQLTVSISPGQFLANFQGVYSATGTYAPGQIVESAGVFYSAILATKGHAPPNATFWQVIGT